VRNDKVGDRVIFSPKLVPQAPQGSSATTFRLDLEGLEAQSAVASQAQVKLIQPESIKGCDDAGKFYGSHAELAQEQHRHRDSWYAANDRYWNDGGYGGRTDDEVMVGDGGSEADGIEGLAFLDRATARRGGRGFARAIDAGAGVGRVTKLILLKRYDSVRLIEANADYSKRRYVYSTGESIH
jgi:hypothetical protein